MGKCISCPTPLFIPEMQRLEYDMSPLKEWCKVPFIWLNGQHNCGINTQAEIIGSKYGFDIVKVGELLRNQSSNETDRGRVIKENIDTRDREIPDSIILDLLKEEILSRLYCSNGFVLNGFPRNIKQANMFIKEICDVDIIIFLQIKSRRKKKILSAARAVSVVKHKSATSPTPSMLRRMRKEPDDYQPPFIESSKPFEHKIEKFYTNKKTTEELFDRIESAINIRLNIAQPETTRSPNLI